MSNRFFKAIEEDDVETVEECLAKGLPGEGLNDFAADGYTPLHKACKAGACKVVNALLRKKADTNIENADTLETCLHLACTTYRDDPDGKMEYEDLIQDLVKAGAMAFPDRSGAYPDVGDDAVGLVANAAAAAEKKGKTELKGRLAERKERGRLAFAKAMDDHISNASACAITVCDSADTEGYNFGSRSGPPT